MDTAEIVKQIDAGISCLQEAKALLSIGGSGLEAQSAFLRHSTAFYQQRVTSAGAPKRADPKTFYGIVQTLAREPIPLGILIGDAVEENKFTTEKDPFFVASVRVYDGLTREGYLVAVQ